MLHWSSPFLLVAWYAALWKPCAVGARMESINFESDNFIFSSTGTWASGGKISLAISYLDVGRVGRGRGGARRALRMVGSRGGAGLFVSDVPARVAYADLAMDAAQGLPLPQAESKYNIHPHNVVFSQCRAKPVCIFCVVTFFRGFW